MDSLSLSYVLTIYSTMDGLFITELCPAAFVPEFLTLFPEHGTSLTVKRGSHLILTIAAIVPLSALSVSTPYWTHYWKALLLVTTYGPQLVLQGCGVCCPCSGGVHIKDVAK